ncbi:hypothetical protein Tco_0022036, partial [Tanacetum coccineum]
TQFKEFFDSKEVNASDFHNQCWQKDFKDYTSYEPETYKRNLLWYMDDLEQHIDERIQQQESLSTNGIALDASLVTERATLEASLVNKAMALDARNDADADIGPSYDSDTVFEVHHDMFENVFAHRIQNHEQPESIPDTYVVNETNSNIISNIPYMDPDRGKEEHDDVDYEQHHALFASLINNLKCDVEKCNEVNREAQQANSLLTNDLERCWD